MINTVRGQTLSRSYGRYIAEFLDEESLVHLGLLDLKHLCRFAVRSAFAVGFLDFSCQYFHKNQSPEGKLSFLAC